MSRYKYICDECDEATFFSAKERTRSTGMKCRFCGGRYLNPSKASGARTDLPDHKAIKKKYDAINDEKQGIKKPSEMLSIVV